ncbi:isoprenylcysteine carboxylmethyltransferase family protein [Ciceribacter sp. L1K23]|uniref:methyltransferase family protein n=1 Tax=Ciceribacter sp. L1K23 TaxID=2820276 RepID=UPI001B824298|nr:isoprenylcysteine carboxylmethyltransferase family protein [Ciceribacter sp. L1K23]MBR0555452.1 isoprenylcysteine carboxylmethyltransferase family protein [Ciceribacter sp. L1K23]
MNAYRLKPVRFPWPPFLYAVAIVAAFALGHLVRLPLPGRSVLILVGGLVLMAGMLLDLWALKTLVTAKTTVMPHKAASHLITTGPYRITRNPIYVGYTLSTVGIGLILGNPWFVVAAIAAALVTDIVVVRREEMHLLARFGIEYESYCRQTRRWI